MTVYYFLRCLSQWIQSWNISRLYLRLKTSIYICLLNFFNISRTISWLDLFNWQFSTSTLIHHCINFKIRPYLFIDFSSLNDTTRSSYITIPFLFLCFVLIDNILKVCFRFWIVSIYKVFLISNQNYYYIGVWIFSYFLQPFF